MFMQKEVPRRRGRPPGRTPEGDATRTRLYAAAIALIAERGYEAATLRDVAASAGVSAALLYRYFPSKRTVVLALYDELSQDFAAQAESIERGLWRVRFTETLALSLRVLGPHRVTLRALVPILVSDGEEGVFSERTAFSRRRVQGAFERAVTGATDAPRGETAAALGRLLYLAHMGVILWWLLDRSPGQRATAGLQALLRQVLPSVALALRLAPLRGYVRSADRLLADGLLPSESDGAATSTSRLER